MAPEPVAPVFIVICVELSILRIVAVLSRVPTSPPLVKQYIPTSKLEVSAIIKTAFPAVAVDACAAV